MNRALCIVDFDLFMDVFIQHSSIILEITSMLKKKKSKNKPVTSHLSSVDVFHYKAQPILSLERVLQRLQHNI